MKLIKKLKIKDEGGFASLIVAAILVIVLALLTVGFAELMRHSQEQALNRQLSDQAYYAAESGVNDAVRALGQGFDQNKTDCGPYTTAPVGATNNSWKDLTDNAVADSNAAGSAEWSCLLINPTPSSLSYNPVDTVTPKTFIFQPVNSSGVNTGLSSLTIYWQGSDQSQKNFRGAGYAFPTVASWNSIGALHFTITPLSDMSRQGLVNNTYSVFLYPSTARSGSEGYSGHTGISPGPGDILSGGCNARNTPRYCQATITGLPNTGGKGYLVSLRSIYSPTDVYITGTFNGSQVSFSGAQSLVDSTGKAQNVLKRIQVRVPDRRPYPVPGFDAEGASNLCKKLSAYPGSVSMAC